MSRFTDRVVVVTGAGGGLGRATAQRLADEGASIVAVDIDEEAAQRAADALPDALGVGADVSDEQGVDAYMDAALSRYGRVDAHHLNAGIFGSFAVLPDLPVEEFDRVMAVNVRGQVLGVRAAFREYRRRAAPGSIVVTASIASLFGSADLFAYHVSKHAVTGVIRAAAVYGGPIGVRVNGVAPGVVPTELFRAAGARSGGKNDMIRRAGTTPLRRAGTPEEIAAVAAFLLSDDASYVTGQIYSADGGASAVNPVRPSGGAGAWDTEVLDAAIYGGAS